MVVNTPAKLFSTNTLASKDDIMKLRNPTPFALLVLVVGLAGCKGSVFPEPLSTNISVNPPSVTVPAGSSTTFTALFAPTQPQGGSLTWSVSPANGGTITNAGVYLAPATAGNCLVIATWTPSNAAAGIRITGSATVAVLPPAQLVGALNTDLVQASGGTQLAGGIQSGAVVGQPVPFISSADSNNNVQSRSGFSIPVCTASGVCQ